jgi:hypothetical protein
MDDSTCMSAHACLLASQEQHILFLAFDNNSFSASMHRIPCHSTNQTANMISYIARSDLGWWNLPVFEVPRARFWAQVKECVVHAVSGRGKPPGRIVIVGDHGADQEFRQVVEDALWEELEIDAGMLLRGNDGVDSERLAARGAAELAWREKR